MINMSRPLDWTTIILLWGRRLIHKNTYFRDILYLLHCGLVYYIWNVLICNERIIIVIDIFFFFNLYIHNFALLGQLTDMWFLVAMKIVQSCSESHQHFSITLKFTTQKASRFRNKPRDMWFLHKIENLTMLSLKFHKKQKHF